MPLQSPQQTQWDDVASDQGAQRVWALPKARSMAQQHTENVVLRGAPQCQTVRIIITNVVLPS